MPNVPETRNREWGFYGTCSRANADADQAWGRAMEMLTSTTGYFRFEPEVARDLLDATWGRHFADWMTSETAPTIAELVRNRRWMRSTLKIAEAIVTARADAGN